MKFCIVCRQKIKYACAMITWNQGAVHPCCRACAHFLESGGNIFVRAGGLAMVWIDPSVLDGPPGSVKVLDDEEFNKLFPDFVAGGTGTMNAGQAQALNERGR